MAVRQRLQCRRVVFDAVTFTGFHSCCCLVLLYSGMVTAEPLPTPLKLEQAMQIGTTELQPALFAAHTRQQAARASLDRVQSNYALEADVNLEAARIQPAANAFDLSPNDHKASLNIRKPLYDFGYTGTRVEAAETVIDAEQLEYRRILAQQQIEIARSFFAALLSDTKFSWDNEAMATLYVRVDKLRDRYKLKQISEVDLLKAETDYQQMLTVRRNTETFQRISRAQLAEVINRPGELSTDLVTPKVELADLKLPDVEVLIKQAMLSNVGIQAQAKRVEAAQVALQAARKQSRPSLGAEVEIVEYARKLPSREDWRASLNLKIPLFEDDRVKANISDKRVLWLQQQAEQSRLQSDVRRQIYDLWLGIKNLISEAEELKTAARAADRVLDKSRGEYELELRTDYGDAMVTTSRVRYLQMKNKFDTIITAMQLVMLTGQMPQTVIENQKVSFQVTGAGTNHEN